jgi:hypothetical protein
VQLADDGDTVNDATLRWPEDRPLLTFGEITLTEIAAITIFRLFTATWSKVGRFPSTIALFLIACSPIPNWAA